MPALAVQAVDATGAGDAFCGALAGALGDGADARRGRALGGRVAAVSVTRHGAQGGLPWREDL